jgi:hypothetical protein
MALKAKAFVSFFSRLLKYFVFLLRYKAMPSLVTSSLSDVQGLPKKGVLREISF